jgi:2-polyprenyl-6-methoxyphenol hydroxylase-like FAD-dependent oxidoreductase
MSPLAGIGASIVFEDSESLMYTMTHKDFKAPPLDLLSVWETHRKDRVKRMLKKARENRKKRKPESNGLKQAVKELIMWGQAMWNGPTAGMEWKYGYKVEDELHLPSI